MNIDQEQLREDAGRLMKIMTQKRKDDFVEPEYAAAKFREDDIYRERCKAQAREWARADKTDPFAYDRAMKDYASGLTFAGSPTGSLFAGSEGYSVMWSQERRVTMEGEEFFVPVPINMKRP